MPTIILSIVRQPAGAESLIGLDQTSRNRFQTSLLDIAFGPTGSTLKYGQRAALAPLTLSLETG